MKLQSAIGLGGLVLAVMGGFAACGSGSASDGAGGLVTEFDSTSHPDSVIARVAGAVPPNAVRHLVELMRIAPAADDTSLFTQIADFKVGPDGRIFVYDWSTHAIFQFDSTGALLRRIGRHGAGPGEFNQNSGMVVLPDGGLAQFDSRNGRISFLSSAGDFDSSWVVTRGFSTSDGLVSDGSGGLLLRRPVTEPRDGEILGRMGLVRLGPGGAFADSLVPPDLPVKRITYVASSGGSTSSMSPRHSAHFMWAWHRDGYFVAADGGEYAIEVSRPGRALRIVRESAPIPVPADERAWEEEFITFANRRNVPDWVFSGPPMPDTKAPLVGLEVDRDGRIWARVATPSERIPDDELAPPRPNGPPSPLYRDRQAFEVYATDGHFLGRVELSQNAQWMAADGNIVWTLERDADGLPAVVRSHVEPAFP
ncbi:MAG TPA: 6-bladed beta-propeller [Gemmatimonadaceae bacterium]|nr:6-bladed beta-propeller [Gemmatimonadaceae bacterium]